MLVKQIQKTIEEVVIMWCEISNVRM